MDLLFNRYASPYLILDEIIGQGRLLEFIYELDEIREEEKNRELWLSKFKIFSDIEYHDFIKSLKPKIKTNNKSNLEAAIKISNDMLNNFQPS